MVEENLSFGTFIVKMRNRPGLEMSLRALAKEMGLSPSYWSDIEKDQKNPPSLDKLALLAKILKLSEEENTQMLDLAGKQRNTVAPDIPEYIMRNDFVAAALRTAIANNAEQCDWEKFVEQLKNKKR